MKILLTNDDGWGSPGLRMLENVAKEFGDVWVVAPDRPVSGISHQMTFEVPMAFEEKEPRSFSLTGTPADCSRVAISNLGVEFDWVISGINNGANLGVDIPVSGTVAAVREASYFGCRGVAVSQYLNGMRETFDWELSGQLARRVLRSLFEKQTTPGNWYNVNLPDTLGEPVDNVTLAFVNPDPNPLPTEYKKLAGNQIVYCGKYQNRNIEPKSDVAVCFAGQVAITLH